jgi:type I restriction enzyme, R subunit
MRHPEDAARKKIDADLTAAGWVVQDFDDLSLDAARVVVVREFSLAPGFGFADYLLYIDGEACGVLEAKREGTPLTGVEMQSEKYSNGLPAHLPARIRPLPFVYLSTGVETAFANGLDPEPRSRLLFHFHRPETLARWLEAEPLGFPLVNGELHLRCELPGSFRARLQAMPSVEAGNLWPAQIKAVLNLEVSFYADRPRALIQMATGSGKTFTAITSIYRLIKFGGAERVLFLVDRSNLGDQARKEFQQYTAPDPRRACVRTRRQRTRQKAAGRPR